MTTDETPGDTVTDTDTDADEQVRDPLAKAKSEAEKMTRLHAKAEARVQKLEGELAEREGSVPDAVTREIQGLRVERAVLLENAQRDDPFVDVEVALRQVADEVDFDEQGQPAGIAEALEALGERFPYMLRSQQRQQVKVDPTLQHSGATSGKKPIGKGLDRAQLEKLYPSLRRTRTGEPVIRRRP